jgi:mRNA interferase MazF
MATNVLALHPYDVVIVPFPFTDRDATKRRPALVLSHHTFNDGTGHAVLAMITSADQTTWLGDSAIADTTPAGLSTPCLIRLKIFTLDQRLIVRRAGLLSLRDQTQLRAAWKGLLRV